jgi:hypothetical protein
MRYLRYKDKTIFHTANKAMLIKYLTLAKIPDIVFIVRESNYTLHLDKRLTDEQIKRFKYYVEKDYKIIRRIEKEMPNIITGYTGCPVTGFDLKYK